MDTIITRVSKDEVKVITSVQTYIVKNYGMFDYAVSWFDEETGQMNHTVMSKRDFEFHTKLKENIF